MFSSEHLFSGKYSYLYKCLKGDSIHGDLNHIYCVPSNKKIPSVVILYGPETRGGATLKYFCGNVRDKYLIVVRINSSEIGMYSDNIFFLARIIETPCKLKQGETYFVNQYNTGWYVEKLKWFDRDSKVKMVIYFTNYYRMYRLSSSMHLQYFHLKSNLHISAMVICTN